MRATSVSDAVSCTGLEDDRGVSNCDRDPVAVAGVEITVRVLEDEVDVGRVEPGESGSEV